EAGLAGPDLPRSRSRATDGGARRVDRRGGGLACRSAPGAVASRATNGGRLGCVERDPHALVALALRLGLDHADATDLAGARDVGPTVHLRIDPGDIDDADRVDARRH